MHNGKPPSFDVLEGIPCARVETLQVHPIFDHGPYRNGECAEEKVRRGLGPRVAEGAVSAIGPSTLGKAVGRPNPVLQDQRSKKIALGRWPDSPDHALEARGRCPKKLRFVSRCRRVASRGGELPYDSVLMALM